MSTANRTRSARIGVLLMLVWTHPAAAQVAATLVDLPLHVNLGDRVTVSGPVGEEWRGRVVDMTPDRLVLSLAPEAGRSREVALDAVQVRRVVLRKGDSLRNGAFIGFGVAVAAGFIALATSDNYDMGVASGLWLPGLLGAAAGAGIDALIRKDRLVLQAAGSAFGLRVQPERRAVVVTVRW